MALYELNDMYEKMHDKRAELDHAWDKWSNLQKDYNIFMQNYILEMTFALHSLVAHNSAYDTFKEKFEKKTSKEHIVSLTDKWQGRIVEQFTIEFTQRTFCIVFSSLCNCSDGKKRFLQTQNYKYDDIFDFDKVRQVIEREKAA